jgi:hypothetical protein
MARSRMSRSRDLPANQTNEDQFYNIEEGKNEIGYQPFVKAGKNKPALADSAKSSAGQPVP